MQDRVPLYPGRVTLTPVEGQANTYDMVREDQPTQAGTPLSKANLLKDATAAQFGLGVEAVPDDVLSWVGKYNEYWWSLLHGQAYSYTEYVEKKTDITARISLFDGYDLGKDIQFSISYSESVSCDEDGVHLTNPTTKTYTNVTSYTGVKNLLNTLQSDLSSLPIPCYMTVSTYSKVIYLPVGSTVEFREYSYYNATFSIYIATSDDNYIKMYLGYGSGVPVSAQIVSAEAHTITVPAGETTYEHSTNRNAYLDSGTVDGITYTFLGKPFEKFPTMPQIEIGNYTGIGRSGQSYQCAITCNFVPKIILIYPTVSSVNGNTTYTGVLLPQDGVWTSWYNSYPIMSYTTISISGTTVSWYSDSNAKQMNSICKFYYIALG